MEIYAGFHESIGAFLLRYYWEGPDSHIAPWEAVKYWRTRYEPIEDEL